MTAILAAVVLYCSAHTADAYAHSGGNLAVLPVKPCYIQGLTGLHRCLNCTSAAICPELKGAAQ